MSVVSMDMHVDRLALDNPIAVAGLMVRPHVNASALAAELGLNITILLWNNDALGQIRDDMVARGIPQIGVLPRNPDFVALAAAFGCEGACPQSLHEVRKCLRRSFSSEGPMLIEIRPSNIFGD